MPKIKIFPFKLNKKHYFNEIRNDEENTNSK